MENISDFEHLKVWQDNPDLYHYLSKDHWNYHVNKLLYAYLKSRYEGNEVGVYINLVFLNGNASFEIDYNQIYGVMFNEAYCFCSYVLTTPAPYANIHFLEEKAKTLCPDNAKLAKPIVAYNILVMTGLILCFANDQNDDVGSFLSYLSIHNSSHFFGDEFHHFEDYCKIGLYCVAGIMADGQLLPPGKLRPGYNYKSQDEYLRKTIIAYKFIAEKMEKNSEEANITNQEEEKKSAMNDGINDILKKVDDLSKMMSRWERDRLISSHRQSRSDFWERTMRYINNSQFGKEETDTQSLKEEEKRKHEEEEKLKKREKEEKGRKLLATNTIFKIPERYKDNPELYLYKIYNYIKEHFAEKVEHKYEWYALRRFLGHWKLLNNCDNVMFASQMNDSEWFGYLKKELQCTAKDMNYYNFLNNTRPNLWQNEDIEGHTGVTKQSVSNNVRRYNDLSLYEEQIKALKDNS